VEEDKESKKYNPSNEQVKYEIGQTTTTMKTIKKKVKKCSNNHQTKILKIICL
jgi:hypothetical protein